MEFSDGEKVGIIAAGSAIGVKLADLFLARWGSRSALAMSREQQLNERIRVLEERLDHKDKDCEERINALEKRVEANHKIIDELRAENTRLSSEVRDLRWQVADYEQRGGSRKEGNET